ncbi:MAG: hypothetical protein HYV77_01105 [Candidatus Wildermuthbacteria bacterium]|nr:hypothetical protein [Candidatus Wildermuthbacteria bacterium]
MPAAKQAEAASQLHKELGMLAEFNILQRDLRERIKAETEGHAIVEYFGGTFSAQVLALLIGWRRWGEGRKQGFRALRSYCGLAVTRVDSSGKPRISRVRPEIRTALYWLFATSKGKEVVSEAMERRADKSKKPGRPKRMEALLLAVWRDCLQ